jgi:hypothetical protein
VNDNGYIQTKAKKDRNDINQQEMQTAADAMQEKLFISQWY